MAALHREGVVAIIAHHFKIVNGQHHIYLYLGPVEGAQAGSLLGVQHHGCRNLFKLASGAVVPPSRQVQINLSNFFHIA
jgi:hypothetical protein